LIRASSYLLLGEQWTFIGLVGGIGFPFPVVFALLSTAADSIGALLVGLGFLTRWAALVIAINMTVAVYFETTGGDPFELPALYLLGAVVLVVTGAGAYSLDAVRSTRSSERSGEVPGA
jgi:putative oxidoreductase